MIVRVSVVLNMTIVNSNSGYSYSMYYIIHDCCDCHWLGLLNHVISKYVLLSTFTEKEKKIKVIFSLDMSILFVHTFLTARRKFFFSWRKSHSFPIQGFHRLLMKQPTSRTEPLEPTSSHM